MFENLLGFLTKPQQVSPPAVTLRFCTAGKIIAYLDFDTKADAISAIVKILEPGGWREDHGLFQLKFWDWTPAGPVLKKVYYTNEFTQHTKTCFKQHIC